MSSMAKEARVERCFNVPAVGIRTGTGLEELGGMLLAAGGGGSGVGVVLSAEKGLQGQEELHRQ